MHVCLCVGDVEIVLMQFLSQLSLNMAPLVTYPVNKKNVCDGLPWTLSVFYSESGTFCDTQPSHSRRKLIFKCLHCMKYSHLAQVKVLIV